MYFAGLDEKDFCCYCGKQVFPQSNDFTKEHLVPKSHGGNNSVYNKKPCCKNCNIWRGDKSLNDFRREVQEYIENNSPKHAYTPYDLHIILENIDWWEAYVDSDPSKFKTKS